LRSIISKRFDSNSKCQLSSTQDWNGTKRSEAEWTYRSNPYSLGGEKYLDWDLLCTTVCFLTITFFRSPVRNNCSTPLLPDYIAR
jgi:hypothetical protein